MTPAQAKVLDAVRERIDAGLSPSQAEIGRACGVTRQAAASAVDRLVQLGHLRHPGVNGEAVQALTVIGDHGAADLDDPAPGLT